MNKHNTDEQLFAFVDDEVSKSERSSILDHLQACEACATNVEQTRSLFTSLGELEAAPVEPELMADTLTLWRLTKSSRGFFNVPALKNQYKLLTIGTVAAGLLVGLLFGDIVRQGLINDDQNEQFASIVLQENRPTINDVYV
ncbi:MAG: zf-HC2 domain-containing protein, partial [SAR324 cluster bacterium]|nr:zf-HC2 domain-containing protein [SAR324 cluster bacterium]